MQKGAKYALVVGDKVYTVNTSDIAALDELNKLAWEQAKVTGTASGDTISVKSVTAAPKWEPRKRWVASSPAGWLCKRCAHAIGTAFPL